ncbi:PP2C family protein-serine/threonine phosphatase [Streptomyces sp. SID3915]|uniref:PP2C family protein-serine/threonine phosphatase n=1 Tax=Streptomyces sp. SID3915 TaxID=2690263 RepID=UPI00136962E2|nr:PP2C family protein-serine/threonine phosphatase [Streptomyces sp. SID3915]MYX73511.1 SpoIIE family protein phosphatase [Streptomyces sp. SID3915]
MSWRRGVEMIPWAIIVIAVVADLATPTDVSTAPLLAAAPVTAAPLSRTRTIVGVGLAAMVVHVFLAGVDHTFGWRLGIANQLTLAAVTVLAVGLHRMLRRREEGARRAERVAEVAQKAVLPTPPARIGALEIAASYIAAEDEALIGGDFYAVRETARGTRAILGDVRGKGMAAVQAASVMVGAFHSYADYAEDVTELAGWLDRHLEREGERRAGLEQSEGFTTALLVEFDPVTHTVALLNRGHPAPLLLDRTGRVRSLDPSQEAPPLGITVLGVVPAPIDRFAFPPGSTLLCITDGVTEARDPLGRFYQPEQRLSLLARRPSGPAELLRLLAEDVERHSHGRPKDDQGILAITHVAPPPAP